MSEPLNYEQALDKLKQVVDQLERGSLGLERSLQLFEEGIGLATHCDEKLRLVEDRVKVLVDAQGVPPGGAPTPRADLEMRLVRREELQ